jgi:peptidoglycan/LPS O-acetylase OafA/YrhL
MAQKVGHIPSLDGIRAVSFLLVFASHAGLGKYVPGGLGVTIFFFLSGFLITSLMRSEYERYGALNLRHFWARRALRILPPFYFVLIVASIVSPVAWAPVTAQLLHITNYWIIFHGYGGMPLGTGVYWSLSIEEHFYILFPWIFIALQRLTGRNQALVLYGICALVLVWRTILVFEFHPIIDRTYMGTDTRVDSIIFGCALAMWHNPVADQLRLIEWRWKMVYVPAAIALLGICVAARNDSFRETSRYSVQGIALTVIFIAAIRYPHWLPMRALNTKPLIFIGLLSYSLYLLHYAVIYSVQRFCGNLDPISQGVLALGISVTCAWIIYITIEKPSARLRRRLHENLSASGSGEAV